MKPRKIRRRRYILSQTSQPRMLVGIQILLGLVALIMTVILYIVADRDLTESYWAAHLAIKNVRQIFLPTLVIVNLVGFILAVIMLIFYTHRISGPVFNFRRVLRGMAQGDLSATIRFRKHDYVQELMDDGNLVLDSLRKEIGAIKQISDTIANGLEQSKSDGLTAKERDEFTKAIQELQQRLSRFKIETNFAGKS